MLSLFPSLFTYDIIAIAVLRIAVAIVFIVEGYKKLPKNGVVMTIPKKIVSIIELAGGLFLLVGLFTQAAAIVLAIVSIKRLYFEYKKELGAERCVSFYLLLFAVSLSFLFLGPGLWGVDYPL